MNNVQRPVILWQKMKYYLHNLNLFPSAPPSTNQDELRNQRISTRLFIFLLILSMIILLLYTSLIRVTKIVNVEKPSFSKYTELDSLHSQTLICPCSKISINYDNLFDIEYTLHQVCSSIFVDPSWIYYLNTLYDVKLFIDDFRLTSRFTFQALKTLCDMSNRTISDELDRFYSNQYISATVVRQQLFESETTALIDQLRSSMTNNFLLSLSMIRETTQANVLFSVLQKKLQTSCITR